MSDLADLIRAKVPEKSNRQIAKAVGVAPGTIDGIMRGDRAPGLDTLDKIAHALKIPIEQLREAAGQPRGEAAPYSPPPEANLLNDPQRRALDELIKSIVATRGATDAERSDRTGTPGSSEDTQDQASEDQKTAYAGLGASELKTAIEQHPAVAYAEMVQDPLELLAITFVGAIDQAEQATDAFLRESLATADLVVGAVGTTPEMVAGLIASERETIDTAVQWANGLKRITPHRAAYLDVLATSWIALLDEFIEGARKPRTELVALTEDDVEAVSGRINEAADRMVAALSTAHQMYDRLRANRSGRTTIGGVSVSDDDARIYSEYEQGLAQTEAFLAGAAAAIQQPVAAQVHRLADHRSQAGALRQSERWAARDLGDEPVGRKIRRRQDEAGETPDPEGPEGGA
ncbi:helix-turn-helix domain-containing protein [Tsukamurella paurometabola]|uniref:Helix-turn-helix n=1 Tax=Tsukamurella paurometabola TaxID=2061 RepID=A0A3P8KBV9_TSUPA|nr:helix-turn-helix transcriptional regulator [Tsukamurella paurometabola]UEA84453.1 helix-turn-helix domain-containing protein [Tsukamurella paurometabola]VDR37018.1 Helix-turn-helix [Tsukamurella paurometabola]